MEDISTTPQQSESSPFNNPSPPPKKPHRFWRLIRRLTYLFGTLWAFGAIYSDAPLGMDGNLILAFAWAIVTLTYFVFLRGPGKRALAWLACVLPVAGLWSLKKPSNERDWSPEWTETGSVEIDDDTVTFHNFRNFDWNLDGTFTERWETRTVHLSKLRALDYFHNPFLGDIMAHPILSYDFGEDGRIALSIETRREVGEEFSLIGGLYKHTELQYLFGDERDFIRVRTNIRDEPMHLYRANFTHQQILDSFSESIAAQNHLAEHPHFYNILSSNCTTSLWTQKGSGKRSKFDYRILINGRLDELIYTRGGIITNDLSFPELRAQALINEAGMAAHDDPDFSLAIRRDRVGFTDSTPQKSD